MQIDYTLATTNNGPDRDDLLVAWAPAPSGTPTAAPALAAVIRSGPVVFQPAEVTAGEPDRPMRPYVRSPDGQGFLYDLEYTRQTYLNADTAKLTAMFPGGIEPGRLSESLVLPIQAALSYQQGYPPIPLLRPTHAGQLAMIRVFPPDGREPPARPRARPRGHDRWL